MDGIGIKKMILFYIKLIIFWNLEVICRWKRLWNRKDERGRKLNINFVIVGK